MRDLDVACLKANSTLINDIGYKDLSNRPIYVMVIGLSGVQFSL